MSSLNKFNYFYNIIKNLSINKNMDFNNFLLKIKDSPFYYSQSLSNINIYVNIFTNYYIYQLKLITINSIDINKNKKDLYKQINNIIDDFFNFIKNDFNNQKINDYIKEQIKTDIEPRESLLPNDIYNLVDIINIINADKQIYQLIVNNIKQDINIYINKIKGWINQSLEEYIINKESIEKPEIFSLKDLKNKNDIGKVFNIDKQLIYEIDNSVKDKFIWIENKYIDSSMGYGINHGQMMINYLRKRRGEKINNKESLYISNSRQPEDLSIETTEEENNLSNACGSFYFNKQIAIIEGRYLIERNDNNYNNLIKELKSRFTHVFDLTISNKQIKQETKLERKNNE